MKVQHVLQSGLIIRQDYSEAVRFVMFQTEHEDWPYATHGGTAFIASRNGRKIAIVCRHTLGDFNWRQLVITDAKFGTRAAGLASFVRATSPTGGAIDSDILDFGVVTFAPDVDAAFFGDGAYVISPETACTSKAGDQLQINGTLKDASSINDTNIVPVYGRFDFTDTGPSRADPVLREASAKFDIDGLTRLTGLSGAPVFNLTQGRLCGFVVRGGLHSGEAIIRYVDVIDILQLIDGAAGIANEVGYSKTVTYPQDC